MKLKEDAELVFRKARVDAELDKLERNGVLRKAAVSELASPLVVVPKANQSVRLCGDQKVSINPLLHVDQYPLPSPEGLFAKVAGSKVFSKIGLSTAYLQLELAPKFRKFLTVNTHRRLYEYQRMNYGVALAPAIFQEIIDKVLSGLEDTLGSPWQHIHVDYAKKNGRNYLLVVDNFSKWLEVFPMTSCTSSKTIEHLRLLFAQFGLPEIPTMAINSVHMNFSSFYG